MKVLMLPRLLAWFSQLKSLAVNGHRQCVWCGSFIYLFIYY